MTTKCTNIVRVSLVAEGALVTGPFAGGMVALVAPGAAVVALLAGPAVVLASAGAVVVASAGAAVIGAEVIGAEVIGAEVIGAAVLVAAGAPAGATVPATGALVPAVALDSRTRSIHSAAHPVR